MTTETTPPVAALFVDLAGVLLDSTGGAGNQPHACGLRAGAGAALRLLERLDYRIIVLAPCTLDRRRSGRIRHERIADLLFRERVMLAGFCCCTSTGPRCDACPPAPAMLLHAVREYGIALPASWLLARDAQYLTAGRQAGCRTLLVGGNDAWPDHESNAGPAAYRSRDIVDAALAIVRMDEAQSTCAVNNFHFPNFNNTS